MVIIACLLFPLVRKTRVCFFCAAKTDVFERISGVSRGFENTKLARSKATVNVRTGDNLKKGDAFTAAQEPDARC